MRKIINGTIVYYNEKAQHHREDGPALEFANGDKEWWVNGLRHRIDGPAVELFTGYKAWYVNGKRHREDGPALEYTNGDKKWFTNGLLHRIDGPAIYSNGSVYYYIMNKYLPYENWLAIKDFPLLW